MNLKDLRNFLEKNSDSIDTFLEDKTKDTESKNYVLTAGIGSNSYIQTYLLIDILKELRKLNKTKKNN